MKALVYSDLQATSGHERCFNNSNLPLQQYRVQLFYQRLLAIFNAHKCDCLWDLGDTFNDRTAIDIPTLNTVLEGLDQFPDSEFNLRLAGNHDQYYRDCSIDNGRVLSKKFRHIAGNELIDIDGTSVFCAAYPSSDAQTEAWLSKSAYESRSIEKRILLGHFQVIGSQMSSGQAITGIAVKSLRPFSLTLLGHVHRPQLVGPNAYYVGSPFQQNFGEKGEDKRVAIVDTDTAKVGWEPLPGFPLYRVCSYAEFAKQVKAEDEHRYQVYLRTPEETESYYAHPLMNRATAIYDYQLKEDAVEGVQTKAWTMEEVMGRYLDQTPAKACGIDLSKEEMLEYGKTLAV